MRPPPHTYTLLHFRLLLKCNLVDSRNIKKCAVNKGVDLKSSQSSYNVHYLTRYGFQKESFNSPCFTPIKVQEYVQHIKDLS